MHTGYKPIYVNNITPPLYTLSLYFPLNGRAQVSTGIQEYATNLLMNFHGANLYEKQFIGKILKDCKWSYGWIHSILLSYNIIARIKMVSPKI